jgi:hypothetical protein
VRQAIEGKKIRKKVPKGTSSYQAAWFLDSDEEGEEKEGDSAEMEEVEEGEGAFVALLTLTFSLAFFFEGNKNQRWGI